MDAHATRPSLDGRRETGNRRLSRLDAKVAYLFLMPYLVLFVVFRLLPAAASAVLSFFDYKITGKTEFVGVANYEYMLTDPTFWQSLRITAEYTLVSVPLVTAAALGAGVLVSRPLRGIGFFRTVYFLPVVTSLILAGVVWQWIYGLAGPINAFFAVFGLGPYEWIQSTGLVLPSIAIVGAWNRFGFGMLIFLAGILAIPPELHESARVDGAGRWAAFRHISWPLLRPQVFFVMVIETVYSVQVFDAVYVMTGGGPARGSYTLVFMIYEQGFKFFNYGYAGALGVALFVFTLLVALVQRRFFGQEDE